MGRQQVGAGFRLDRAHEGQGDAAARSCRGGLRQQEPALAETHGDVRQIIVAGRYRALLHGTSEGAWQILLRPWAERVPEIRNNSPPCCKS